MSKVQNYDYDDLSTVSLDDLVKYIVDNGWVKTYAYGQNAYIYCKKDAPEILVPRSEDLRDYAEAVRDIFETFGWVAGEGKDSVRYDVKFPNRDVIYLRAQPPGPDDGTININLGFDLFKGAYHLLKSGVSSCLDDKEAKTYLEQASWGLTERGSYVVSILSPSIRDVPSARDVTTHLERAIEAARIASTEFQKVGDKAFDGIQNKGVTYSLCKWLANTIKPSGALDISFSLAAPPFQRDQHPNWRFDQNDHEPLEKALKRLQSVEQADPKQSAVSGYVVTCKRRMPKRDENQITFTAGGGEITLRVLMPDDNKRQHNVIIKVSEELYKLALEANGEMKEVKARGRLQQRGDTTSWDLHNALIDIGEGWRGQRDMSDLALLPW